MKANTSVKDANSNLTGKFSHKVSEEVGVSLALSSPHHYNLQISSDWKDRFEKTALKISSLKLKANCECDESNKVYPTTFNAYLKFATCSALHVGFMSSNTKQPVLEAEADIFSKLYQNLYGGAQITYDDKAKALTVFKYGLLYKAFKGYSLSAEYSRVGDK